MNRKALTIAALLSAATFVSRADDLEKHKDDYYEARVRVSADHTENMKALENKYASSLKALLGRVKKDGDLKKTLAVKAEIARFENDRTMPDTPAAIPEIESGRTSFKKYATNIDLQKGKQLHVLAAKYDAALDQLQRKLVAADKLEEATAIQNERDRAKKEALQGVTLVDNPEETRAAPAEKTHFDENAFTFKGHGYYRLPLRHTHPDARLICRHLGGHLLSIDNSYEYQFIQKKIAEMAGPVWLDLTDEKDEGTWRNWRGARATFLRWHKGEPDNHGAGEDAACLGVPNVQDMADFATNRYCAVICEWDPGMTPNRRGLEELGLCEISMTRVRGVSVQALKPGVQRLSGGYKASFSHVSADLIGAQFTRVPWQSRPTHRITVTKPGYLYAYKIHEWPDRTKFSWERIPDAVKGGHHGSGADRVKVRSGDTMAIKSYETGVIAARISVE